MTRNSVASKEDRAAARRAHIGTEAYFADIGQGLAGHIVCKTCGARQDVDEVHVGRRLVPGFAQCCGEEMELVVRPPPPRVERAR